APGSNVLYPEGFPYGATLHGKPVYVNWYSPSTAAAFTSLRDEAEGLAFLRERQIEYVIGYPNDPGLPGTRAWALRGFLARYGLPLVQAGDHVLYRVEGSEIPYVTAYSDAATHTVEAEPRLFGSVNTGTATAIRYNAEFACASDAGYFGAQINWDNGKFYYHEVPCSTAAVQFVEAVPVPPGATGGELWGRVSGTGSATLTQLIIETH
ncbi:MAG: hypothetical protein SV422_12925, partial [Pseudomonadota bacterium]|nr:hypothetical protein [Pseudomonadota bacterium]